MRDPNCQKLTVAQRKVFHYEAEQYLRNGFFDVFIGVMFEKYGKAWLANPAKMLLLHGIFLSAFNLGHIISLISKALM